MKFFSKYFSTKKAGNLSLLIILSLVSLLSLEACASETNPEVKTDAQNAGPPPEVDNKPGYELKLKVNGTKDSVAYLAYHFGTKQYNTDTAYNNGNGEFIFAGPQKFRGGLYMYVTQEKEYFEFILDKNQHFGIEADAAAIRETMKFTGSRENTLFYDYQKFITSIKARANSLTAEQKKTDRESGRFQEIQTELESLQGKIDPERDRIISENPNIFLSAMLKALSPPSVPKNITAKAAKKRYMKDHWFDDFDFNDSRLLRTPAIMGKINNYLRGAVEYEIDSLTKAIDMIINKARVNPEMYKFMVVAIFNQYSRYWAKSDDAVYMHMAEKYYLSGLVDWVDQGTLDQLKKTIDRIKPNVLGQPAPPLFGQKEDGSTFNIKDIKAEYTLIYFWSPTCEHCQKITPEVMALYEKYKGKGMEFIGFCTSEDIPEWKTGIQHYGLSWINVIDPSKSSSFMEGYNIFGTPMNYILDKDKKIISKRLGSRELEEKIRSLLGIK